MPAIPMNSPMSSKNQKSPRSSHLPSLPLTPPPPHSLDDGTTPRRNSEYLSLCSPPVHESTPLRTFVAQNTSAEPVSWRLYTQPQGPTASLPAMPTVHSPPREGQRPHFLPSPLLSDGYSSGESVNFSPATLGTPPSSARSSSADIDPVFRTTHPHEPVYTPSHNTMSGHQEYNHRSGSNYDPTSSHRRESHGELYYGNSSSRRSPTRRSPEGSPRSASRAESKYIYNYTPYGLETRPAKLPTPAPSYSSSSSEMSHGHLPLPSATRTRYGEILPPPHISSSHSPNILPPTSTFPPYGDFLSHHTHHSPSYNPSTHWIDGRPKEYSSEDGPLPSANGWRCSKCKHTSNSSEQFIKHQQKHLKAHHCRFENCTRTEGFATPNDRERHEKSVHKIPGQYWKCMDESCSSYGKEFSRRDNLKDHLRRMHHVPDGLTENEASTWRSRLADSWKFQKQSMGGDVRAR